MSSKVVAGIGAVAVAVGVMVAGGKQLMLFINPLGLLLVVGGSVLAVVLAFPWQTIRGLWVQLGSLGKRQFMGPDELAGIFAHLARVYRVKGVRAMEEEAARVGNDFLQLGVGLVADQRPVEEVRQLMYQEMEFLLSRRESQRAVLSLLGRLAPAFGLAGTVAGLVRMLHAVSEPVSVAQGMSVALLTTLYGLLLANLVVLPLERKLVEQARAEAVEMSLVTEGVVGLAAEEAPAEISARLMTFTVNEPATHSGMVGPWAGVAKSALGVIRSMSHGK